MQTDPHAAPAASIIPNTGGAMTAATFRSHLLRDLSEYPYERGARHPAADLIADALTRSPDRAPGWVESIVAELSERAPSLAAVIIQTLAQSDRATVGEWGPAVVREALGHQDVELREAALVAIDLWDDPALVEGLDPDREPKQWLADHMRQLREHHQRQAS